MVVLLFHNIMKQFVFRLSVFFILISNPAWADEGHRFVEVNGENIVVDLHYNSTDNFLKKNVYAPFGLSKCYVHRDMYDALQRAAPFLKANKLKLVMWDCYRPLDVQREMWKLVPDARFVANPKNGSNHNRGAAIDVTLADADGNLLPMPTGFDDFSAKAAPSYKCKGVEIVKCQNRDTLAQLMKGIGLQPIRSEWWHYELPKASSYPVVEKLENPFSK